MIRCAVLSGSVTAMLALAACTSNSQEKNYKMLEEDRPMFESEHKPMSRTMPQDEVTLAALEGDAQVHVQTAPPPTGGSQQAVIPTVFEDRHAWEVVAVGPADGRTYHWPAYFRDCPLDDTRVNPVTPEAAFEQYVRDDTTPAWTGDEAAATVVQPVKFFFDLVVLPVRLILVPPVVNQTTP